MSQEEDFSLKEIIERNHQELRTELGSIKEQVIKTNGRVRNLELWRAMLAGGFTILTLVVLPIAINYVSAMMERK